MHIFSSFLLLTPSPTEPASSSSSRIMVKRHQSVAGKGQNLKIGETEKEVSAGSSYREFYDQQQAFIHSLAREMEEEQKQTELICKNISQTITKDMEETIKRTQTHFHKDITRTNFDFIEIRSDLEMRMTTLGRKMSNQEGELNRKYTGTVANELQHFFEERSLELHQWQQNLKLERCQKIDNYHKNASQNDRNSEIANCFSILLGLPAFGSEEKLISKEA